MPDEQTSEGRWWCRKCGIVRGPGDRPWCRHYALDLPAARMEPTPPHHPLALSQPEGSEVNE